MSSKVIESAVSRAMSKPGFAAPLFGDVDKTLSVHRF